MILPFPLFHGTSDIFLSSIRQHGLGGKNIVVEWRGFEFLSTAMSMLDRHIDRTNPETQLHWKMLEAVSAQRVDHFNVSLHDTCWLPEPGRQPAPESTARILSPAI
jgi:hypothetical protein